jgi:hypothetical protein
MQQNNFRLLYGTNALIKAQLPTQIIHLNIQLFNGIAHADGNQRIRYKVLAISRLPFGQ